MEKVTYSLVISMKFLAIEITFHWAIKAKKKI